MKFSGKELFELGVPQSKIKFLIGLEFSSVDELKKELTPTESKNKKKFLLGLTGFLKLSKIYLCNLMAMCQH